MSKEAFNHLSLKEQHAYAKKLHQEGVRLLVKRESLKRAVLLEVCVSKSVKQ